MTDKTNLLIIFNTGKCNIIHDVIDYGVNAEARVFYFIAGNIRSFLPIDGIRYFGDQKSWSNGYTDRVKL